MEFITQNTKKNIKIVPASFQNAVNLKKAVMKCLLDASIMKEIDNLQGLTNGSLLDKLSELILNADISPEFETAIFDCLGVCIYENMHKITVQLFDDVPELREDYYEIISKCAEVNLRPFFRSLVSELKTRFQTLALSTREQK